MLNPLTEGSMLDFNCRVRKIFYLVILFPLSAFSFNGEKCGNLFPKVEGTHPPYYSPFYASTMIPSTTSYFSSIGNCSMYGDGGGARASYVQDSFDLIAQDAAKGKGEYLLALSELSGCSSGQFAHFAETLRGDYDNIFSNSDTRVFLDKLDRKIQSSDSLKNSCKTPKPLF